MRFVDIISKMYPVVLLTNVFIDVTILLVDGKALTKLMIKHNFRVSIDSVYEIKKSIATFLLKNYNKNFYVFLIFSELIL